MMPPCFTLTWLESPYLKLLSLLADVAGIWALVMTFRISSRIARDYTFAAMIPAILNELERHQTKWNELLAEPKSLNSSMVTKSLYDSLSTFKSLSKCPVKNLADLSEMMVKLIKSEKVPSKHRDLLSKAYELIAEITGDLKTEIAERNNRPLNT